MMKLLCILLISLLGVFAADFDSGIRNKRVERIIDLSNQFARHTIAVEFENTGSKAVSKYDFIIDAKTAQHLAFVEVVDEQTGASLTTKSQPTATQGKYSFAGYSVELGKSISSGSSMAIRVKFVFSHTMNPFPTAIAQDEKQLVRYHDNHFFFSPYPTASQTTTVKLATPNIESKTELAPTSVSGNSITYGPYEDTAAFSFSDLSIHFENGKPFITAKSLVKEIEVSHWGANVAIEELYDLQHEGATLKGTFSRFDYQRTPPGKGSVVPLLKQTLPVGAADVYYRDEIGNISTSHLFEVPSGPVMDVIPRYPLFGGWKIGFYFGYNLPSSNYLFTDVSDSSLYLLNVSFASAFPDVTIDELTVRIILPEGARNAQVHAPFGIDSQHTETHFTYLDTSGRPVIVLTKKNVVPEHNRAFQVTYNFTSTSLLQEPFLLIGAFFLFFVLIMVYTRINFRIGPKSADDS